MLTYQCKATLYLVNETNKAAMGVPLQCGCWKCNGCSAKLREKWISRATKAFERFQIVGISICTDPQFESLTRRLRRNDLGYFRLRIDGVNHVFHQPFVTVRVSAKAVDSRWLAADAALAEYTALLASDSPEPSCSAIFQTSPVKNTSGWKREAIKRHSIFEANRFLARVHVNVMISPSTAFRIDVLDVLLRRGFPPTVPLCPGNTHSLTPSDDSSAGNRTSQTFEGALEVSGSQ